MPLRRMLRMIMVLTVALTAALSGAIEGGASTARADDAPPLPGRQLLFFNHAYGVLDRETADAIEHSDYLREFANFEVRTTTGAGGKTWKGRYLMGRDNYLELFGVGDLPGQDAAFGSTGMGLSVEHDGDLETVTQRLPDEGVANPVDFQQTRDFGDGVPVPWFDAVLTTEVYDSFGAWGMEYRPEYFADPRGKTEPASYPGDVSGERYLSDEYRSHLMRNVSSIRLAVTARDLASTVPLLRSGGFVLKSVTGGGVVAVRGGTTIRFDAVAGDQVGLRQIELSLNRSVDRQVEQIGRSTLVVGPGAHAVWTFAGAQ